MVEKHYGHLAPSYITEAIRTGAPRYGIKPARRSCRCGPEERLPTIRPMHWRPRLGLAQGHPPTGHAGAISRHSPRARRPAFSGHFTGLSGNGQPAGAVTTLGALRLFAPAILSRFFISGRNGRLFALPAPCRRLRPFPATLSDLPEMARCIIRPYSAYPCQGWPGLKGPSQGAIQWRKFTFLPPAFTKAVLFCTRRH